ncbi:MAG: tRNA uridine-5-carboxymethylaminomethyl(34) synthesis GTPase MnmE [Bacteroidaceae bacterium]|nr:tRNA uridine-5-carboxymethylaminomethyl(34) synthesis GTPase MnmE [Bacteroidaceae bacterium]
MNHQDTICAVATAPGGAIGIIRTSGPAAIEITDRIFCASNKNKLTEQKAYRQVFGHIVHASGEVLDEVLVSIFRAPNSYTGENSTEISCHGSPYILQQVVQLLLQNGCRTAAPGEFTQRAFLNGKMDLSQAEAVADLIASSSAATHRLAMNQMKGGFSKELGALRDQLLHLTSLLELELDFSDHEDLEFADRTELQTLAEKIETTIQTLCNSFSLGNAIKNGVPVAIIGETNTGKSTLLNTLLKEDKAIVSDIHGTTRDVIEDTINIGGTLFRFIDTAGIRQTTDTIENIGIEKTFQKIKQADIILWLIDATQKYNPEKLEADILSRSQGKHLILLINKCDLISETQQESLTRHFSKLGHPLHFISAKTAQHIRELEALLVESAAIPAISQNDLIVTNARHYEALSKAHEAVKRVINDLKLGLSGDFISQDLRECIHHLSDIVGEVSTDSVLQNIFKHFCIGK